MSVNLYPRQWGGFSEKPYCWFCDDPVSTVKKCANCLTAIYCDKECQRRDWHREEGHKFKCKRIVERKKREEELKNAPPISEAEKATIDKLFAESMKSVSQLTPEERKKAAKLILDEWEMHNRTTINDLLYPNMGWTK